ncbi:trans-aconitate 2-methyltransferase [Aquimarina sp. RZ0]|uniref:class I SAM-dependent methyltransferase n=1 Tax=Aquimarina sp. RZ0 TaxID=2607730 RepID=UPI0011F1E196|nr:methyltransferase domain-containing protein [Aquimarina sp. RZ0]KAA1244133.1 methyltransferase domain-containing protein [Aquimarina sp. RZ0]
MSLLDNSIKPDNGVYHLTEKKDVFSSLYITVRELEKRVYSDDIVMQLPLVSQHHHYYKEWQLRQKSTKRIVDYLTKKNIPLKILDLGCGNGWFSYQLSLIPNSEVYAVDVNDVELTQASRVFKQNNLQFIYADIFAQEVKVLTDFDIVTVNSCIQYFENLPTIVNRLQNLLKKGGELHIWDSPFYESVQISNAQKRTKTYYQNLGVPEMVNHYFHHSIEELKNFEVLYKYKRNLLNKILNEKDSPFCWFRYVKE